MVYLETKKIKSLTDLEELIEETLLDGYFEDPNLYDWKRPETSFEILFSHFKNDLINEIKGLEKLSPALKEYSLNRLHKLKTGAAECEQHLIEIMTNTKVGTDAYNDMFKVKKGYKNLVLDFFPIDESYQDFVRIGANLEIASKMIRDGLELFENSESTIEETEFDKGTNPYPRIFKENKHAQLFEYLHDSVERNELAEYSFIYRKMMEDRFIYDGVKQSEFKNWLNETYKIEPLDDLKTLTNCTTDHKYQLYQMAKLLFQC